MGSSSRLTSHPDDGTNYSDDSTVVDETPDRLDRLDQPEWPDRVSDSPNNGDSKAEHAISSDLQLRRQALDCLLQRGRRKAEAEYIRTSDASVFTPYLVPFMAGKKKPERKWFLDQPTQRWYLYDPDTEEVLWCPTADSFA